MELSAVDLDPVALSDVMDAFGASRSLSFDHDPLTQRATVELAHDALLTGWDRLANWLEDHREDLQRQGVLAAAAEAWEVAGRDPDFLLTGSRLGGHEAWARRTDLLMTSTERAFLDAGIARHRAAEAEAADQSRRQRRAEQRARRRLVALVATLTVLAAATTYGILAWPGSGVPDVAMIFGGTGDAAVNDLMARGLDRAAEAFDLTTKTYVPPITRPGAEVEEVHRLAEAGVGLIVYPGCVDRYAADYPETWFIGSLCEGPHPNASTWVFHSEQGGFLAGAAAALKTQSEVVGFIGGGDFPQIWGFQGGFETGAKAIDPDVRVLVEYLHPLDTTGFDSPGLARQVASGLYERGADVIFHAAGRSGIGVFQAAADVSAATGTKRWAIGVDADQYETVVTSDVPGLSDREARALQSNILTSVLLRYDHVVYEMVAAYVQGTIVPGFREFDLSTGGLALSYSGGFIDDIRGTIEELGREIVAGDIEVAWLPCEKVDEVAGKLVPPSPRCV